MSFDEINSFLAPLGLIIAGVIMKLSNNQLMFGKAKKYWLYFILMGFSFYQPNSNILLPHLQINLNKL
jgi:hypothetical protein